MGWEPRKTGGGGAVALQAQAGPSSSLPFQAWDLASLLHHELELCLADLEIRFVELRVLAICRDIGPCTATDIGHAAPVEASSVSRIVHRLYQQGLVSRRRSRDDRRVVWLRATRDGYALLNTAEQRIQGLTQELAGHLDSANMEALASAVAQLLRALRPPQQAG